mmetsp:Transcript_39143/g.96956  ORF Transcript_39143/g.96956 Transcript_39143/m.96956 type:complete len:423 (-) Transcript_39143:39-1307(-)
MSVAVARAVFTPAESDAFARQKEAQAALRRDEKRLVKKTHSNTTLMTKSVKDLRDVLASGDADGDGGLDYAELTAINPVLYETLGLKDATALLKKFDYNNDGQLDIGERRQIIRALIPQLDQKAKELNQTGEYISASFLWQNLKSLKATLKKDHRDEIATLQEKFSKNYHTKVEDKEEAFFRQRVGELHAALTADWDEKEAFLERVFKQKFDLLYMERDTTRNPTGPIVAKFPSEVLQIRAKLMSLSHLKRPDDMQLMEGTRLQKALHHMEDNCHAKHATLSPAYFSHQEKDLTKQLHTQRKKSTALRIKAFDKLGKFVGQARDSLDKRHRSYASAMDHAHKMGMHELVLEEVRPVRTLPMLPVITSKTPATANIGKGGLDRLSNGLSAYRLPHDITPPAGHILRVTAAGPPRPLLSKTARF